MNVLVQELKQHTYVRAEQMRISLTNQLQNMSGTLSSQSVGAIQDRHQHVEALLVVCNSCGKLLSVHSSATIKKDLLELDVIVRGCAPFMVLPHRDQRLFEARYTSLMVRNERGVDSRIGGRTLDSWCVRWHSGRLLNKP
ncbi:MAG: hypothetical protein IPJ76_09000 [Flavobacteriales bacterium]|nr:MAG: hypothetical protein IPJ76_09000 [Flavobacteriales bacterium]